jgi:NAD(P)-dependent dehydrogenase (short-subunit alcohol dehydrogenase family)
MMISLEQKVAVVTGSGRGIGLAAAQAVAAAGAAVVINDVDEQAADDAVAAIADAGGRAVAAVAPIGSTEAAEFCVERALSVFGRLDVMCANAGILRDRVLWNTDDEDFDAVIATHLRGTFTCARAAMRHFRSRPGGGRLILLASLAGQRGNFGQTAYSAAKAGIAAFARTWSMECAKSGVTVNAIVPNALTRMVATMPLFAETAAAAERGEPIPARLRAGMGMGTAADVAPLFVFLASDQAAGITGQCIGIGGDKLSLWSHPQEIKSAYRDGGWTAERIAEAWGNTIGQEPQSVGINFDG